MRKQYVTAYEKTQYEDIAIKFSAVKAVCAKYIHQEESTDQGNALLEALPPMRGAEESLTSFQYSPYVTPEERKASVQKRMQMVLRVEQFRIARKFTHMVDQRLYEALRRSYRSREHVPELRKGMLAHWEENDNPFYRRDGMKSTGFSVIGASGGGKTTSMVAALQYYPQVIMHEEENRRYYQLTYIKVECPANGSMASFYDFCLSEIQRVLGNLTHVPSGHTLKKIDQKEQLIKNLVNRFNLGVLVIDEIQNLLRVRKKDTLNHLLTLSNDIQVPLVFVGTYQAYQLLAESNFYSVRRFGEIVDVERYQKDRLWDYMMEQLWELQWLREKVPLTDAFKEVFYRETGGIIDRVLMLFQAAQISAIENQMDTVKDFTPKFIETVSKKIFPVSREKLLQLSEQGSNCGEVQWDDLYDMSEKEQFVKSIRRQIEQSAMEEMLLDENLQRSYQDTNVLRNRVIRNLYELLGGVCTEQEIEKAFETCKESGQNILDKSEEMIRKEILAILFSRGKKEIKKRQCAVSDEPLPLFQGV